MSVKHRPVGPCHICGIVGPLSYEHIPPEKAFNDRPVLRYPWSADIALGPQQEIILQGKPTKYQRGAGQYTLCEPCNNETGAWYGNQFIDWCYQGMDILIRAQGRPSLIYLHHILPLRVLKQIVTMFFSVNGPQFHEKHHELEAFVKNRWKQYLHPQYRFFVYYNIEGMLRFNGGMALINLNKGSSGITLLSEISFPPFGYVMTIDAPPPDRRLVEITHFARYGYNEFASMPLQLPVLPTHLWIPGDYRNKEEIIEQMLKGRKGTDVA
jgi:hypothetical protein